MFLDLFTKPRWVRHWVGIIGGVNYSRRLLDCYLSRRGLIVGTLCKEDITSEY